MGFPPFNSGIRQEELIEIIIEYVYQYISKWRDACIRPNKESEKILNPDLPKFLTTYAHENELPINFFPEEPQGNMRTIDFSVCYDKVECYNKPITVFECKRLSKKLPKDRKEEYVTGHKETTGGIQRFKLEAHGKEHEIVGMIGYVQTGTYSDWLNTINNNICDLCGKPDENGLYWAKEENLETIEFDEENGKSHSKSNHKRITKTDITIHHLWVNMQKMIL